MPGQAQPRLYLGPVVAGVQDTPPEHPNSLPLQPTEEGPALQPPGGGALSKLRQTVLHQPDVLVDVRLDDGLLAGREEFFAGRLLGADELSEEPAFGEKLVSQDRADRVRLVVRLEVEQGVRHRPPDARRLVRLADAGGDDVPEDRLDRLRHVSVGDGDEVVFHGRSFHHHIGG